MTRRTGCWGRLVSEQENGGGENGGVAEVDDAAMARSGGAV